MGAERQRQPEAQVACRRVTLSGELKEAEEGLVCVADTAARFLCVCVCV